MPDYVDQCVSQAFNRFGISYSKRLLEVLLLALSFALLLPVAPEYSGPVTGKKHDSHFFFLPYISVMKIGLISDTHGNLDGNVFDYFKNCDEIWHAGDIGDNGVAEALEKFKPFKAVYGNIDSKEIQLRYPEDLLFTCEGLAIFMSHIGGTPPGYKPRIKKILKEKPADIFICGHSHILKIGRDPTFNNMLFINPGAAGNQGFHSMKTMVRFEIINREIKNLEVIELGKRGLIA
jgi:putative phosphoesterase